MPATSRLNNRGKADRAETASWTEELTATQRRQSGSSKHRLDRWTTAVRAVRRRMALHRGASEARGLTAVSSTVRGAERHWSEGSERTNSYLVDVVRETHRNRRSCSYLYRYTYIDHILSVGSSGSGMSALHCNARDSCLDALCTYVERAGV